MTVSNGNGFWKWLAIALSTFVIGMGVRTLQEPKDIVTQRDLSTQLLLMQTKLDAISSEVTKQHDAQVKTTDEVHQLQIDTARIAEKLGVPALPGVALKPK